MLLKVYHTTSSLDGIITFPDLTTESDNWLGDGFYFWQDPEFADWWGDTFKCKIWNTSRKFDVYEANLEFNESDFIDTVFNENDYYNFVSTVEKFAKKFQKIFRKKPTLDDFNLFLKRHNVWESVSIIRFQDVPANNQLVEVNGYYYKKRIQIRVNKAEIISSFAHLKRKDCLH
jgi:hypothetical protein